MGIAWNVLHARVEEVAGGDKLQLLGIYGSISHEEFVTELYWG